MNESLPVVLDPWHEAAEGLDMQGARGDEGVDVHPDDQRAELSLV